MTEQSVFISAAIRDTFLGTRYTKCGSNGQNQPHHQTDMRAHKAEARVLYRDVVTAAGGGSNRDEVAIAHQRDGGNAHEQVNALVGRLADEMNNSG